MTLTHNYRRYPPYPSVALFSGGVKLQYFCITPWACRAGSSPRVLRLNVLLLRIDPKVLTAIPVQSYPALIWPAYFLSTYKAHALSCFDNAPLFCLRAWLQMLRLGVMFSFDAPDKALRVRRRGGWMPCFFRSSQKHACCVWCMSA